jgi:hypothetical protein
MTAQSEPLDAVRRKLNVTWDSNVTDERVQDVVDAVSPRLSSLLGFDAAHDFSKEDGEAWGLFLNACLYEFSDAWDDFTQNYEREIQSVRLMNIATATEGDEDAEAQG